MARMCRASTAISRRASNRHCTLHLKPRQSPTIDTRFRTIFRSILTFFGTKCPREIEKVGTTKNEMSSDQTAVIRGCIKHKLLSSGGNKLYVSYYRQKVYADVHENGSMQFQGKVYTNATALALAMKRTLNPSIKTEPGWISLFATDSNTCLKDIREQWIEKITPPPPTSYATASSLVGSASSSYTKSPAIRPKPLVQQPGAAPSTSSSTDICQACKRDRGSLHVTCDACHKSFHHACLPMMSLNPSTTPWYCDGCIQQHCAIILKFLYDLRHVAKHCDAPFPATPVPAATLPDREAAVCDATASVEVESAVVADGAATVAQPRPTLLAHINHLIDQLESPATRMNVLANSTGELLVHLSNLDIAAGLRTLDENLAAIATACSRENEPIEDSIVSPGVDGILKVLNLRHGILSAKFHAKRTTAALATLSEKRKRAFVKTQAKLDEGFQKELKVFNDWAGRVQDATDDVEKQHVHITHMNALIDNSVRHRKTLRAASLKHRFIPAYRTATQDLSTSSDHLLVTIVADKLQGLAASLNEWESIQEHFERVQATLMHEKTHGMSTKHVSTTEAADATEPPLKRVKVAMDLPRPPSLKLLDRQLNQVTKTLASLQSQRTMALKTLTTFQNSFAHRIRPPLSAEWKALMHTMDVMVRKCQPVHATPSSTSLVGDAPRQVAAVVRAPRIVAKVDGSEHVERDVVDDDVERKEQDEEDGPEVVSLDEDDDEPNGAVRCTPEVYEVDDEDEGELQG
ncbi:hypothetical protein H310_03731 [Aphanomyces invadans]|uniref:PHD-type domain-containing protein n=1 Tax=Aphanomyces invadans TaxID=157072 RepID=A0A024UI76_9STRA|nr:hypothetical protein H310_03731 [Aphanomyces invadans]ETW06146.1 hypothetical protein H310_03731 [Aphanomyces invadans]|eukprot:XP_008865923.1 hypothetical protein H310_03731 [Aphanomyces invadans]